MKNTIKALAIVGIVLAPSVAGAETTSQVGTLACDVSKGIGMIIMEKQTVACTFTKADGAIETYTGSIEEFGVALGETKEGHLVWGVLAATVGVPEWGLAGSYAGVSANASLGIGGGANVLVGGVGRSLSLQPLSVEGQVGINIAGGVTTLTLEPAP
jgi:hypothetical protein